MEDNSSPEVSCSSLPPAHTSDDKVRPSPMALEGMSDAPTSSQEVAHGLPAPPKPARFYKRGREAGSSSGDLKGSCASPMFPGLKGSNTVSCSSGGEESAGSSSSTNHESGSESDDELPPAKRAASFSPAAFAAISSTPTAAEDSSSSSSSDDDEDDQSSRKAVPLLTRGGRAFTHSFSVWAKMQITLGRNPKVLLRALATDMGIEADLGCIIDDAEEETAEEGEEQTQVEEALASPRGDAAMLKPDGIWVVLRQLLALRLRMQGASRPIGRAKLPSINTFADAVSCIANAKNILVLTGAGISVSCGIPDFRSENGIYSMLGEYNLPTPSAIFDIRYFRINPSPFFKFARHLLPGSYVPSATHRFIKLLDDKGQLLRNYTQNIDGLEREAGVSSSKVHQCHGSLNTATCLYCRAKSPLSEIEEDIRKGTIPMCKVCDHPEGIVKPDIVFFGESLGSKFTDLLCDDRRQCDLVLVMGSSLQVAPVSHIQGWVDASTPQILINREVVGQPHKFDVELLGDADAVANALCDALGGKDDGWDVEVDQTETDAEPVFEAPSTYYFRNGKKKPTNLLSSSGPLSLDNIFDLDAACVAAEQEAEATNATA